MHQGFPDHSNRHVVLSSDYEKTGAGVCLAPGQGKRECKRRSVTVAFGAGGRVQIGNTVSSEDEQRSAAAGTQGAHRVHEPWRQPARWSRQTSEASVSCAAVCQDATMCALRWPHGEAPCGRAAGGKADVCVQVQTGYCGDGASGVPYPQPRLPLRGGSPSRGVSSLVPLDVEARWDLVAESSSR